MWGDGEVSGAYNPPAVSQNGFQKPHRSLPKLTSHTSKNGDQFAANLHFICSKDAARKLVEFRDIIEVEPMSQDNALSLMERKLERIEKHDIKTAGKLAVALEYMPLAIVQATSYIVQRAPRISLQYYLDKLQQSDRKRAGLLDYEGGQLRRDNEAKNSIILT